VLQLKVVINNFKMVLEAIVVVMDNSEFNRNGDFAPSRWESQQDAANNIIDVKLNQNPENTLGIMSQAGARVEIRLTQTNDFEEIQNSISSIEISNQKLTNFRRSGAALQRSQNSATRP
jgi:26S proteasome regulatory subunit N10